MTDREPVARIRALGALAAAGPWVAVLLPLGGAIAAVHQAATRGVGGFEIAALVIMYSLTMLGITLGYHRLFAHRSFGAPPVTHAALGVFGSMAFQGPVIWWVTTHRRHHKYTDRTDDPHTPYIDGSDAVTLRGLWHAYVGWLFRASSVRDGGFLQSFQSHAPDLLRDPVVYFIHMRYWEWVAAGLALPALAGGLWYGSWDGALRGLVWGGLLRIFLVSHAMWSVNAICHTWGSRPYHARGRGSNVGWLAPPTFGESWHNHHHAFPVSSRFGFRWWQIDLGHLCLRAMSLVGLARGLSGPSPEERARKLAPAPPAP